jgi:3-oxoacyl-[acyl-carrier protein] reductase
LRYSIGVRGIDFSPAANRSVAGCRKRDEWAQSVTKKLSKPKERDMPRTPDYFAGKTILITGAASGIGRATALIFAREGANVVCADINEQGARDTAAAVNGAGGQALALKADVTSREDVDEMVARAVAAFGAVHFLFNSAGAAIRRAKFLEIDDALLDKTFALNVNGTFYAMQAVLPHMLKNKHGVIVNMASMAHRRGGPGSSIHYAAAKGAVVSMTMGVAREFATQGIRALSISPGPIQTPFQAAAQSSPELVQRFLEDVPMKRFGEPEEIGELVLFMCSDACPFMTADTVYVNGGGGWR